MKKIISVFMILVMVSGGISIFPAITNTAIGAELVYGEFIDINDETDVEILPRMEVLNIIEETEDKNFEIDTTIGEIDVSYWEHEVNSIKIKNDYILLQEDAYTEEMVGYDVHWRDVSDVSFEFDPSLFEPDDYFWKQKVMFLTEDDTSDFYTFYETQEYPGACWEVRYTDGTTLLYDFNGNEIGWGIQAPSEKGFSMNGYDDKYGPGCWMKHRKNADEWFKKWCGSTVSISSPASSVISSNVKNGDTIFFYELAHGHSYYFINAQGEKYRSANVKDDMSSSAPMKFAFIGSCEGMEYTGPGTFSYEFRKGQMTNTVTIGFDGMASCSGWWDEVPWQDYMFRKMDEGNTIKHSFDLATARYPLIAPAVVFVGDPNLKIVGNLDVWTDKETYSIGENVAITLENNEDETIYFSTTSHWSIEKDVNGNWETIYPGIVPQMITQLGSGETEESTWNQKDADGTQVGSGDYRVVTAYSMNDLTFTKYAYFSIVGYVINPLFVNTDKSIYAPDQNVGITVQNIGTNTLSLKKWYVEKKTLSGIWETIYESSIFSDYIILPINDTFVVTIPYNDTIVTIPVEEPIIVLPNETVGIWSDDAITIGNWTTISPIVGGNSGISVIDSIDESNITGWTDNLIIVEDWAIEPPVIGWTDESSGLINYTAISSSDISLTNQISANSDMDLQDVTFDFSPNEVVGIDNNLVTEQSLTFTEGEKLVYSNPGTMLLPNQKLTWTWPQTTSDGGEPGFGEYRVKVEYDDNYATSSPFSITVIFTLPEEPIIWTPSINLTYNLTTEVSIGKISISETPTFVYNPSSAIPIIETIIGTDLNPSIVKITTNAATDKTTIEVNSVTATTIKPLIITNSNLLMSTSLGYGEVKILPNMVKEKASLKSVKNMELKEYNNKPVYQVNGVRESKLLWFIPVDMDVTVHLNAETGSVEKMEKPWWGFLAS